MAYSLLAYAYEEFKSGNKVAFICSTIKEVQRAIAILLSLGVDIANITPVISGYNTNIEENASFSKGFRDIVITTYAYLNEKGHSQDIYRITEKILNDRVVIADEAHMIPEYSQKVIQLGSRYKTDGNILVRTKKCLKSMRKGSCKDCHYLTLSKITRYKELDYYSELPFNDNKARINHETWKSNPIYSIDFYKDKCMSNVLSRKIANPEELKSYLTDFPFVRDNVDYLENIEIRMQLPYLKVGDKKERYILREELLKND